MQLPQQRRPLLEKDRLTQPLHQLWFRPTHRLRLPYLQRLQLPKELLNQMLDRVLCLHPVWLLSRTHPFVLELMPVINMKWLLNHHLQLQQCQQQQQQRNPQFNLSLIIIDQLPTISFCI
jgi:hypothetical protein